MRQALLAGKAERRRAQTAMSQNIPAPVGGWNTRDALAEMGPLDATRLDNFFPRLGRVELRGGSTPFATGMTGTVKSLLQYGPPSGVSRLYGVTNAGIYDITAGGAAGAVVQALTNGYFNYINIANSAGTAFLWGCNGTDTPKMFDGATWSTPSLTVMSTPANLVYPLLFKHRIFVIEKNSMNVWFLPIDSVQGAMSQLPYGNIFRLGGYLVSHASWTLDSGDGSDDLYAVVSSQGELAVYQGIDPSSASAWALIGVWKVGIPLGRRCFQRLAGDVLLLTENGVFPLSRILKSGKLNFASALSNKIQSGFTDQVTTVGLTTEGWSATIYPQYDAMVVNSPAISGTPAMQFVMNTVTGAWCSFSGLAAFCFDVFNEELYFGTTGGTVTKAWGTLTGDNGNDIVATAYTAYNYFNAKERLKHIELFRPILSFDGSVQQNWGISPDYTPVFLTSMLPRSTSTSGSPWDTFLWDTTPWGGSVSTNKLWRTAAHVPGYALALWLQLTTKDSSITWSGTDYVLGGGGLL